MSQENVEIVRRWFAAIAEGELFLDLWDADLIVDNIPEFPVTGPYRGYEGAPWAAIWIVRRGKLCRVSGYATREQALEAVGLSE
jgi:hypothetical protein